MDATVGTRGSATFGVIREKMPNEASRPPLPASVSEYTTEYPSATPDTIMTALDLAAEYRAQLEHYCAVTRYSIYAESTDCEKDEDLRLQTVEWADVADWEVSAENLPSTD